MARRVQKVEAEMNCKKCGCLLCPPNTICETCEITDLKDKLHRRNMQIKDLRKLLSAYDKYIQEANDENKYIEGWYPVCIKEFKDCELAEGFYR